MMDGIEDGRVIKPLNMILLGNCALGTMGLITTFFLLGQSGGFTSLLTCATYIMYSFAAMVMLNSNPSAFSIGILIGSSCVMVILAFEHTLYWTIESYHYGYAADIFSTLFHCVIFVLTLIFTFTVYKHRHALIDAVYYATIPDVPRTPNEDCPSDYDEEEGHERSMSNATTSSNVSHTSPSVPTADI
ncbi:hypothetical protein THRCLA_08250 [Thraustotheca clavata]|uniref:Transmembrane protein n=1 Tax=Thraustotheca clavata TaxID=74557 RepID=A0A1V9Z7Y4_9STRA|nr:hypothetical protein THRCLA_08250 [Thraustotheca clavata]